MLWKSLRALCTRQVADAVIGGHAVTISTPPLEAAAAQNSAVNQT
ncbi:MAG: hypothetical protein WDN23_04220 [Edaphobacter sp.]